MLGTPGSNFLGAGAQVAPVMVTFSIIDPPVRKGGSSASNSLRPQKIPIPVGPTVLWPENARKSISRAFTSTGICGTDWQASKTTTAPTSCARFTISCNGIIVPRTFDWCVSATTFVLSVITCAIFDKSNRPSGVTSNHESVAPVRAASCCHGMRLAWCSISVTTIPSPALR